MLPEYASVATPVGRVPATVRVVEGEGGTGLPDIHCGAKRIRLKIRRKTW
jgi:hypothetical protein